MDFKKNIQKTIHCAIAHQYSKIIIIFCDIYDFHLISLVEINKKHQSEGQGNETPAVPPTW